MFACQGAGSNVLLPKFIYFFLGAHAKFGNPTTTLSGRTVMAAEKRGEKEEEKKSMIIVVPSSDRLTA